MEGKLIALDIVEVTRIITLHLSNFPSQKPRKRGLSPRPVPCQVNIAMKKAITRFINFEVQDCLNCFFILKRNSAHKKFERKWLKRKWSTHLSEYQAPRNAVDISLLLGSNVRPSFSFAALYRFSDE